MSSPRVLSMRCPFGVPTGVPTGVPIAVPRTIAAYGSKRRWGQGSRRRPVADIYSEITRYDR